MNQPIPFIAATADEAVAKIRAELGAEAVVLNVRPLPANGIARLWQKPMIEVLAHVPQPETQETPPIFAMLAEFREQINEIKAQVRNRPVIEEPKPAEIPAPTIESEPPPSEVRDGKWHIGTLLQKTGLLPLHAQSVVDQLQAEKGEIPPASLEKEIKFARALLAGKWVAPRPIPPHSRHVLIGPSGSGKTTLLCKWLTQTALVEGRSARVWRLDSAMANMAESLSVYCEILGVPSERSWQVNDAVNEDIGFIDLPGIDWRNASAMRELGNQLRQYGSPQIHLVLNGAYDISILLAQVRAFSVLPIEDLVITHLDEETRWGKIWNLALGTNYAIRHFSTGQNIPGDFCAASPEMIFSRQFLRK